MRNSVPFAKAGDRRKSGPQETSDSGAVEALLSCSVCQRTSNQLFSTSVCFYSLAVRGCGLRRDRCLALPRGVRWEGEPQSPVGGYQNPRMSFLGESGASWHRRGSRDRYPPPHPLG